MKRETLQPVTRENFGEYEKRVWRMECKRSKAKAAQRAGRIVGDIAFVLAAVITALYGLIILDKGLEIPMDMGILSWLRSPLLLWHGLCGSILPGGCSEWIYILFSVAATALIALAFYIFAALVVGLVHTDVPFTPLEGSESEKADTLHRRCIAAELPLKSATRKWPLNCFILFMFFFLNYTDNRLNIFKYFDLIDFALVAVALWIIYGIPNITYQCLSNSLLRIRQNEDLRKALVEYGFLARRLEAEQAAEQERKLAEENRLRGDELYRRAIASKPPDEKLIAEAADLGSRPACLHMGRSLTMDFGSDSYTRTEKAQLAETAKKYLKIACMEVDAGARTEARFLLLHFQVMTESGTLEKWRRILNDLRQIRDSGRLPKHLISSCDILINTVVAQVDSMETREGYSSTYSTGYSGSSGYSGGYSDSSFDAKGYVDRTCSSQIYGIVSSSDIDAIDSDTSLTPSEKEAAKSELQHQADMYY